MRNLSRSLIVCLASAITLPISLLLAQPADAALFTVTKTADTNDGVCNSDCSLREAIVAFNAQAALGGSHTIDIPAGTYVLTRAGAGEDMGATGDLDIAGISNTASLEMRGAGLDVTVLDGGGLDRVLHIQALNAVIELSDLTIRGGSLSGFDQDGAGLFSQSTLTLARVALRDNQTAGSALNDGGGLYSIRSATLMDCIVEGNSTAQGRGGGIFNLSTLTLTRSTVSDNHADGPAGVGGGIASLFELIVEDSTIDSNSAGSATGAGGGIYTERSVQMTNSTVSGNDAPAGAGSEISVNIDNNGIGSGTFTHATVVGDPAGSEAIATDGVIDLSVVHSIVVGACNFVLLSSGGNVESPGSTCGFLDPDDQASVSTADLALGALASNGGPTKTHALNVGSVAIDAGLNGQCAAFDQRGVSRPEDGDGVGGAVCDPGAYERETLVAEIFSDDFETGDTSRWSSVSP